jgi:ubiquinone/menaquinone biosynthesis C-methylase UbiE
MAVERLLRKEDGRYALTATAAAFLDRRSPTCVASAIGFLFSPLIVEAFGELTAAVRKGGTAAGAAGTLEPEHPVWVEFARSMAPMAAFTAELLATLLDADAGRKWKVLDIAAGHGLFGITIARRNRRAQIYAQDWANVLSVAQEFADQAAVADRFHTIPGSAFDVELGTGYDLVLLTNFLHHFDPPTCEKMLHKVHAALKPGGRAVTVEFVPNEDRISPPDSAGFSLVMLATTPSGDAYTFSELGRMFANAGFSQSDQHELTPSPQRVVISHK